MAAPWKHPGGGTRSRALRPGSVRVPERLAKIPSPLQFFARLKWIDGRDLLETIELYRRRIFTDVLWTFDGDRPRFSMALCGRGKKNFKTSDLILACLYRFLIWPGIGGNDCAVIASDLDQAADDLDLIKKLIAVNPLLDQACEVRVKEVLRRDGGGKLVILPAGDAMGLHGKTFNFLGVDELHTQKDYAVLEALAMDPTRSDALAWLTSYASIFHRKGAPLYDFMELGKAGSDPRLFFSWYASDFTTDPDFASEKLTGEQRANPSMASWADGGSYLETQRKRLPSARYRRLHLNLPGSPEGAAFDADAIMSAIITGRKRLPYDERYSYYAGVDMSGGSSDNACLAIVHQDPESGRTVLDVLVNQGQPCPFNPREAISRFAAFLKEYNAFTVNGDQYAGNTFRADFEARGISYRPILKTKHVLYEALEAPLLAHELEWLDLPEQLAEEALGLVYRGAKIDHFPNGHDDHVNAVAVATYVARHRDFATPVAYPWFGEDSGRVGDYATHIATQTDHWGRLVAPIGGGDEFVGSSAWVRAKLAGEL